MKISACIKSGVVAVTLALAGCGGGGSSPPNLVATFIDSPVSGLEFKSSSGVGRTDTNGNFVHQSGDKVQFRLGNFYLGTAKPQNGKVTPLDLIGTNDVNDPRVVLMLRTLQSLDSDANLENGIQISAAMLATLNNAAPIDFTTVLPAAATADQISSAEAKVTAQIGVLKVDAASAIAHFKKHKDTSDNSTKGYTPPPTNGTGGNTGTGGTTTGGTALSGRYTVIAWNDLGMHCMDGKDYSVFSILPPYNNLHAHVIRKDVTSGKQMDATSGITLTYEATLDEAGSLNTISSTKTNFWDWVQKLFGANPGVDRGLNLGDPNTHNPTPSLTPIAMSYDASMKWWHAEGLPITPYDDKGVKNYYPMVKVVAKDSAGNVLASTRVVLPVSDEMSCKSCHASTSGNAAARPIAGWINETDAEKDWKKNILRLHDEKFPSAIADAGMQASYTGGTLSATVAAGQPVLCAACHKSNALQTSLKPGIKPLTEALHGKHANVSFPGSTITLDSSAKRDACYLCHPGSSTKCLRGVMGNVVDANGVPTIDCQSCHGSMSTVGKPGREGWLDQPNCQNCHDRASASATTFSRYTSVFSSGATIRSMVDTRFATAANTPMTGKSLYRFSTGHGGLQCEACHGPTHAEYPSSHANDNAQSLALQGHIGTISECTVCHATMPTTRNGGPHGMHQTGQSWVSAHQNGLHSDCALCHGTTSAGSPLAVVKTQVTFNVDGRTKTFAAGTRITCWSCHNGPNP